jgi:SAM-dependent methyltransferase
MDTAEIKELVRGRYGAFAETGGTKEACCASMAEPASGYATDLGLYSAEELTMVPEGALSLSRGCGNPTGFADLQPGEAVVDFGCGGGIDVILAAQRVGSSGRVIGVDGTPQMVEQAWRNVGEAAFGDPFIDLRVADLAATGLPDGCADVVISNCVINLCPDKDAVYHEAFRVLRPGGHLAISDVVLTEELPGELEASLRAAWAGCLGGAVAERQYLETVREAGFQDISVVSEHAFSPEELDEMSCCPGQAFAPKPAEADLAAVVGKVTSIKFTAVKPA